MPSTKNFNLLADKVASREGAAERLAELRQETLAEIGLYELRRRSGVTQAELAEELGIGQSAVSQLEHGTDPRLSTLRSYIAALGGELQLRVTFPDDAEVTLRVG